MTGWLAASAVLLWLILMVAGLLKYRAWTLDGLGVMLSNREAVPAPGTVAARADRAAGNMLENFVIFAALVAAVHFAGRDSAQTALGAAIFFFARLAYWPVYLAGIIYLRTALWAVAVVGMALIAVALL